MLRIIENPSYKTKILLVILFFIGFQQFPVLYVGGSLKIYEVAGILLMILYGIKMRKSKIISLMLFFFVVSPLVSLFAFYLLDDVESYYMNYPSARNTFRFNIYVFPILQLLFMLVNYVVLYNLYYNEEIYKRFEMVLKGIVLMGTIIACYSITAMFLGDPISHLPSFLQNKHVYDFRSSGLSQEPSNYILYQGWILIFCWLLKDSISKNKWIMIFLINSMSFLFTFSSSIVMLVGVVAIIIFLFSKFRLKIVFAVIFSFLLSIGYNVLTRYVDPELVNYAMIQKVEDFILGKDDAGGSGGFRHYESSLGWIVFQDNPILGVGVGNSNYFMHEADKKSSVIPLDEQLNETSFPPNTFSCVFAEQGAFGGILFLLLLAVALENVWKYRKEKYGKLFLCGTLFNIETFIVIAPVYSMYLWAFLFMVQGYIRYTQSNRAFIENADNSEIFNYENCN